MDVYATVRILLKHWCDPDDILEGETLISITDQLLESEDFFRDADSWEVLDAQFIVKEPKQLRLPETQPTGRGDWHI